MIAQANGKQKRRKISLACEPCRERKSRCDGVKPICSTCRRRSLGLERCVYKLENARTASTDEYVCSSCCGGMPSHVGANSLQLTSTQIHQSFA